VEIQASAESHEWLQIQIRGWVVRVQAWLWLEGHSMVHTCTSWLHRTAFQCHPMSVGLTWDPMCLINLLLCTHS